MNLSELNKHLDLIQKLHKAQELYQNISAKTLGATKLDGMPHGSGVGDKVGMLAIELADLEARINYLKFEVQKNSVGVEAFDIYMAILGEKFLCLSVVKILKKQ